MKTHRNKLIIITMSLLLVVFIATEWNMSFSSAAETAKPVAVGNAKSKWEVTVSMKGIQENGIKKTDDKGITQSGKGINEAGIKVYSYAHEIISPRDAASGLPTGKRMHKPFVITKELDKSTPLLYMAFSDSKSIAETLVNSRNLETKETISFKLIDATIVDISTIYGEGSDGTILESVSLMYKAIEITSIDANGVKTTTVMKVE